MKCYAAYAKDINVRKQGSSGGIFPILSKRFIKDNDIVYASVYNDDFSVAFERINNIDDLQRTYSSKYVQSNSCKIYKMVESDLSKNNSILFCGTPCQVCGLKKYLKARNINMDRLLTVDFVCHGVPSFLLFDSFLKSYTDHTKKLISLNMRNKDNGWNWGKYSWEFVYDDGSREIVSQAEVPYMNAFTSDAFLRPSCYNCNSKRNISSDITLGDFWGISFTQLKLDDRFGVSAVMVNSLKGEMAFNSIFDEIDIWDVKFEDIYTYNRSLRDNRKKPYKRINALKKLSYANNVQEYLKKTSYDSFFDKIVRKVYQALPNKKTTPDLVCDNKDRYRYLYDFLEDCCGCMACVSICPCNAIEIKTDLEGFNYPIIEVSKCINCNKCEKVCPQR